MTRPACSVVNCDKLSRARGWCDAHYQRWQRLGDPEAGGPPQPKGRPIHERFLDKVEFTESCWLWQGARQSGGYGSFAVTSKTIVKAHRFAYEFWVGPIPDGLNLDHLCRVRNCVKPDHLEPVTQRENVMRSPVALATLEARQTHCLRGHEFTEANTRAYRGRRYCRECNRQRHTRDRRAA